MASSIRLHFISALTLLSSLVCSTFAKSATIDDWPSQNGSQTGAIGSLVSSNAGPSPISGLSINQVVGASRFYNEGYNGSRAIVTNVEGGHVWNGHETLTHVNAFFDARPIYVLNGINFGRLGQADRHATWVGQAIAGRTTAGSNEYQRGIADGAQLWSGSIATSYGSPPWSNNWSWDSGHAFTDAYSMPMLNGLNGRTTDVVNSSWIFGNPATAGGNNLFSVTVDGLARQSRATVVFGAGNNGLGAPLLGAGNGYNTIVVGALGTDTSPSPYATISSFSTRGPQLYNGPDGSFGLVRARVDITAPGENLTLALYGGLTGGNVGGLDPTGGSTSQYSSNLFGTSFATPLVSGGATLLADVAYDRFSSNVLNARDGQVIKSVLLNSATKPAGWNNGQTLVGGTVTTTQSLDYNYGAGILNLNRAFDQYVGGTTDLNGLVGGSVESVGWDYGVVSQNGVNDYFIDEVLEGGTTFSATLNWFVGRSWLGNTPEGLINVQDANFTDLRLELWSLENGLLDSLVAISNAGFINTEHFSFQLPQTDSYALRVIWSGERYDFVNNSSQTYGLAWSGTAIPEPAGTIVLLLGLLGGCVKRCRTNS